MTYPKEECFAVVKYPNRRLYSLEWRRYITLDDVGKEWDKGREIHVFVHRTDKDITVATLLEVIKERVLAGALRISEARLRELGRVA